MNNIHEFKNLFIEFETETKKRANEKYATLDEWHNRTYNG